MTLSPPQTSPGEGTGTPSCREQTATGQAPRDLLRVMHVAHRPGWKALPGTPAWAVAQKPLLLEQRTRAPSDCQRSPALGDRLCADPSFLLEDPPHRTRIVCRWWDLPLVI